MTSVVIPGLDLVPSLPSRVVTVDLVDMTEGEQVAGAKIDFFLPADLHVPADDKILQAGRVTLTLNANGHGEIRLPAYTDTVRPTDWVIGVKKHWAPHPYYIRVPQGSTKISLADIPAVEQIPDSVIHWMVTGASATITQGAQWAADLNLAGGILQLGLTVPPGGTAWARGALTASSIIDELKFQADAGVYNVTTVSMATALGLPGDRPGSLTVQWIAGSATPAAIQTWEPQGLGIYTRAIGSVTGGSWTPWTAVGGQGGSDTDYALGHSVRVARERQASGRIGTNGLGVFALRLDHNIKGTVEKVLPLLRARGIPASQCHFVNQFNPQPGYTGDTSTGYSWADVEEYSLQDGIEVWSHGWSHQDTPDLEHEIVGARSEIETQMPLTRVRGFMVPGITGSSWDGFTNNLANPDIYATTEAGRLILSSHAASNGGGGVLTPLAGETVGWQRYAIDSAAPSSVISVLKQAQQTQTAAILMLHPSLVDNGGVTTAELEQILDYMATERDAGRAMILTVWGALNADPSSTWRHTLIRDHRFEDVAGSWANASGWNFSEGVASTSAGGVLAQAFSLANHAYAAGSSRELAYEVRATSGATVGLRVYNADNPALFDTSRSVDLPASTDWVTVQQPLLLPTGNNNLRIEIGRISGGPIEMQNPRLQSI